MKRAALISVVVSALALAFATAGCNDSGVVAAPAQPSPTDTPAQPEAPIAVIDSASPVYSTMDTASFDGWLSYDPDGYIVSYQWDLVTKPASSTATLTPSVDGTTSTMFIDIAGDYSIKLTVTDNDGLTGSTTYDFSATPSDFHVRLSWPAQYTEADMDLHLINTTAVSPAPQLWDMAYDCHWRNCKPSENEFLDWGGERDLPHGGPLLQQQRRNPRQREHRRVAPRRAGLQHRGDPHGDRPGVGGRRHRVVERRRCGGADQLDDDDRQALSL